MLPAGQKLPSTSLNVDRPGGTEKSFSIVVQDICKAYKLYSSPFERMKEVFHPCRKKYHKQFAALSDVSFTVAKGDVVGIIGRNGSGKTTLLQLISGIVQPTSGSVTVDGRISALLELGTGFKPELSGRQNIYICGSILGLSRREIDACFSDIVAFSDIGAFIEQPVKTYSSGMYIRLAFSLAISVKPDILIVDEALAVGDTLFQAKCFAKIRELQQKGITIIFVTHSLDLITRFCNKACLLNKGKLITFGTPKHVVALYNRNILKHASLDGNTKAKQDISPSSGDETGSKCMSGDFYLNPAENRYGNGKAIIERVEIYDRDGQPKQELITNGEYEIRIQIVFVERILNPIISYRIQDMCGIDISGTNTLYHEVDTEIFKPGDTALISFYQKMPLNSGEYFLSASCAGFEKEEYVVYDRRYDALPFQVATPNSCAGLVDLAPTITLSREDSAPVQTKL